jgi:hypothetical protein
MSQERDDTFLERRRSSANLKPSQRLSELPAGLTAHELEPSLRAE